MKQTSFARYKALRITSLHVEMTPTRRAFFLKSILKEICWRLQPSPDNVNYPTRAPSWSWAAWDAPIYLISSEPRPGQMLAACVSDLHTEDSLPPTLHCVGKLIQVRWDEEELSLDEQSLQTGLFYVDSVSSIDSPGVGCWFPVYLEYPWLSSSVNYVVGIVLRQTNLGTFRRVGYHSVLVSNEDNIGYSVSVDSFLVTYNRERTRLIELI